MATISKLTAIGIMAVSFIAGFLSYYMLSNVSREDKKKHIGELISQLINFVIFMWVAKIILNFPGFLSDPLSVLAYPGDSSTFYLAVLITLFLLIYKKRQKKLDFLPFVDSFVHVFLIASFLYEFIEVIFQENMYAFGYLILLAILIGLYFFLWERMSGKLLLMVILCGWSLGMIVLAWILPFVTVFGYMMQPWFVGLFFVIILLFLLKERSA
ncbi:hypothetical protein [Gracilibacillus oryzae]|uniref:hypothetical protein n=1 Tax=Gracilibacillus oryzae TaxID=1672701 RepID=UPI001885B903|nr:hypothetical protein [Gracilibacillus oryzae]